MWPRQGVGYCWLDADSALVRTEDDKVIGCIRMAEESLEIGL
jgi:hypothetical protein